MSFFKKSSIAVSLFIAISFAGLIWLTTYVSKSNNTPEKAILHFESTLNSRYKKLETFAKSFDNQEFISGLETNLTPEIYPPEGFSIQIFDDENLIYWSDNSFVEKSGFTSDSRIQFKPNGIYQYYFWETNGYHIIAGDLIKHRYPYTNNYLSASFIKPYHIPSSWVLTNQATAYPVVSNEKSTLFYFKTNDEHYIPASHQLLLWLLGLLFLAAVILLVYNLYRKLPHFYKHPGFILLFITDIAIVRGVIQYFHFPAQFYLSRLFDPSNYASSIILPNMGDLLITLFMAWVTSLFTFRYFKYYAGSKKNKKGNSFLTLLLRQTSIALIFVIAIYLIDSIFINSTFELGFSRIFDFILPSYLAFIAIATILATFFLFSYPLIRIDLKDTRPLTYTITLVLLVSIALLILSYSGLYCPSPVYIVFLIAYVFLISFYAGDKHSFSNVQFILLVVAILTGISGYSHYKNLDIKERNERKLMAIRISAERDNIAEYMFTQMQPSIAADTDLKILISLAALDFETEKEVKEYLMEKYFKGYWNKYAAQITICYPEKTLQIKPADVVMGCNEYFAGIIASLADSTLSDKLFYISESYNSSSYIARLPIQYGENETASLIIEFYKKYAPKGLDYPELLLDKSVTAYADISGYSYAIFDGHELVKNVGEYTYSEDEIGVNDQDSQGFFFHRHGYNHYIYNIENGRTIIISKKKSGIIDKLTPYTFQWTFHILIILCIFLVYRLIFPEKQRISSFKTRLQLIMVALILFASVAIGIIILNNIIQQNNKKNQAILSEKAHSVLIELEHKISKTDILDESESEYLEELLTKYSLIFFSDINLYDPKGTLMASSRKEIFTEGLKSVQMQREAYTALAINKRTLYIMQEKIGNYGYLSAYIPFRDNQNKTTAFINLPYFARQQELQQEISAILVTIINIYVILTALAILVSLIVANHLTQPLQMIRERFSRLSLSSDIEKIDYQSRDELGDLINEYNLMVEKLAESAAQLARSERESAWREMARQVAHEIKNPLTPMKLSIQHLEKAWKEDAPDWSNKLERTTKNLIRQIDSLSAIATAFSDFAKLPTAKNDQVDLSTILRSHIGLFSNYPNIDITFNIPDHSCFVFADDKQLSRVFVNLFTNAIQAIPTGTKGQITITLSTDFPYHIITISDNGMGMTEEQKLKIFSPNFTTKSSGTGLGLAMVKNIIESSGGNITFTSVSGQGTTFEIELPEYVSDQTESEI